MAGNPGHLRRFLVSFCIPWVQFGRPGGVSGSGPGMEKSWQKGRVGGEKWVEASVYGSLGGGLCGECRDSGECRDTLIGAECRDSCLNVGPS